MLSLTLSLVARSAGADDSAPAVDVCRDAGGAHAEDSPGGLLARSACQERAGRLVAAWQGALAAQRLAASRHSARFLRVAQKRVADLSARIPKVTLERPANGELDSVSLDGVDVPLDNLRQPLPLDPGRHRLQARGKLDGRAASFERGFGAGEREAIAIRIVLASAPAAAPAPAEEEEEEDGSEASTPEPEPPAAPNAHHLSRSQLDCLRTADSPDEVHRCVPAQGPAPRGPSLGSSLVAQATLETGGYSDSNSVNVLSPSISGTVSSPTAGWNVGAGYTVDLVSAASPDIVSEASPPFHEVRHAGTLTGGYKPGLFGVQVNGDVSSEPDYLSMGAGASVSADLDDKLVTPTLGVHYSHDTIGRSTTPFSVFHHSLDTTEIDLGVTLILSRTSLIHVGGTVQIERGDQSKPYRYVPLFDPAVVSQVVPGQSIASVNLARESLRPLEQLPLERERYAVGARFVTRFPGATLRVEERLYADTWSQYATTSDLRLVVDVGPRVRLWPHGRLNLQTGTSFYKLAYSAIVQPGGTAISVPIYRTGDRELSPSLGVTGGGGARVVLTAPGASDTVALTLQVDALYDRYFQSLFETGRTGLYGTLGLEVEFE